MIAAHDELTELLALDGQEKGRDRTWGQAWCGYVAAAQCSSRGVVCTSQMLRPTAGAGGLGDSPGAAAGAEWAASAAALAQQLPDAIAASAPQQATTAQVETSTRQLHLL